MTDPTVTESGMAHPLWWEVVGKRWLRAALFHAGVSSLIWFSWETVFSAGTSSRWSELGPFFVTSLWGLLRLFIFVGSQLLYLCGKALVLQPEEVDAASAGDVVSWILRHTWWLVVGAPLDKDSSVHEAALYRRIRGTGLHLLFTLLCPLSGFVAIFALVSAIHATLEWKVVLELSVQGAALGFIYFLIHLYQKRAALVFPIVQVRAYPQIFGWLSGIPMSRICPEV